MTDDQIDPRKVIRHLSGRSPKETTTWIGNQIQAPESLRAKCCAIHAEVDSSSSRMSARVRFGLETTKSLSRLRLNLSRTLHVSNISSSFPITRTYRRRNVLGLVFEKPVAQQSPLDLEITYEGPLVVRMTADQVISAVDEHGAILTELWFPWLAGLRCKFEVRLHVPAGFSAVANGVMCPNEGNVWNWSTARPITTFEAAVGRYHSQTLKLACGRIHHHSYASDPKRAAQMSELFGRILAVFVASYGPLPSEDFHLVQIPDYYQGGRGRFPMIWLSEQLFKRDLTPGFDRLLAHEISHFWWGNLTEGKGPGWLWLQEGLAAYSEMVYIEAAHGQDAYQQALQAAEDEFGRAAPDGCKEPLAWVTPGDPCFRRLIHAKGAIAAARLRQALGDAAFFEALRRFGKQFAGCRASVADLRHCMEQSSGLSLARFFHLLLYENGLPVVQDQN